MTDRKDIGNRKYIWNLTASILNPSFSKQIIKTTEFVFDVTTKTKLHVAEVKTDL